jgi:hypothetical protein
VGGPTVLGRGGTVRGALQPVAVVVNVRDVDTGSGVGGLDPVGAPQRTVAAVVGLLEGELGRRVVTEPPARQPPHRVCGWTASAARFANNLQLVRLRHANAAEVDRVLQFDEVRPFRVVDPIPPA